MYSIFIFLWTPYGHFAHPLRVQGLPFQNHCFTLPSLTLLVIFSLTLRLVFTLSLCLYHSHSLPLSPCFNLCDTHALVHSLSNNLSFLVSLTLFHTVLLLFFSLPLLISILLSHSLIIKSNDNVSLSNTFNKYLHPLFQYPLDANEFNALIIGPQPEKRDETNTFSNCQSRPNSFRLILVLTAFFYQ